MSLAMARLKMRFTSYTVTKMRALCDQCNVVLESCSSPFRSIGRRLGEEAPWVVFLGASSFICLVPLLSYPMLKPYLVNDVRAQKEEERVRLCLQKGIDPYPYMRHKDYVFGNTIPATQVEEEVPAGVAWEHQAMERFQRAKEELRKEVGGNPEDSVQKLMERRVELRKEFERSRFRGASQEPRNLVFWGRKDVDHLNS